MVNFLSRDRGQVLPLPIDLREWLKVDNLAHLIIGIIGAVERVDIGAFKVN